MAQAKRRGFTLVEVLTVIAIIALLAAMLLGLAGLAQKSAAKKKAQSEISQLEGFVTAYQAQNGKVPQIPAELTAALQEANHPLAGQVDPWRNPHEYQASSRATFYLWSTAGSAVLNPATAIGTPPP